MPSITQRIESGARSFSDTQSIERVYDAWPYANGELAETAVLAVAPIETGLVIQSIDSETLAGEFEDAFTVTLGYGEPEPGDGDDPEPRFSFDIGSETKHVTYAQSQQAYGTDAPDLRGGIGWNGERFEGAESFSPTYTFSETHYFTAAEVTAAYKAAIYAVANSPINNAPFRGFLAGEVLFLGVTGQQRDDGLYELTFNFAASPNVSNLSFGDVAGVFKPGWARVDIIEEEYEDAGARFVINVPKWVYVNEVPGRGNFGLLAIGA